MTTAYYNSRSPDHCCPRCAGSVLRVRRSWGDRLIDKMFGSVRRFRCEQFGCGWEGRLAVANTRPVRKEPLLFHLTDDKLRRGEALDRCKIVAD
jgi:hypothetical protein